MAITCGGVSEPELPAACHDELPREIKLLVGHREHLVAERTRMVDRLRWHLHRLDPDHHITARTLPWPANIGRIRRLFTSVGSILEWGLARELLGDVETFAGRIDAAGRDLHQRVRTAAPHLLALPGCGDFTTAKIVAETAGIARFHGADAYAA